MLSRVLIVVIALLPFSAAAETVKVKYQGYVDISNFECPSLRPSSFVNRICFDEARSYAVVLLRDTYYHYCQIGSSTIADWRSSDSLGRYYNRNIKDGEFNCRDHGVPD